MYARSSSTSSLQPSASSSSWLRDDREPAPAPRFDPGRAALEGAPSCNGRAYWHIRREGVSVPIDLLRQQGRAEMEP